MKSKLWLLLVCLFVVFNSSAQIYSYTTSTSGAASAVATNATGTGLSRVNGAGSGSCGTGFTSNNFTSTTTYSTSLAAIQFTVKPNVGYKLNVTNFTAGLRRSSTGPASVRYAYSLDNGSSWIDNGSNYGPNNASCGSTTTSTWTFSSAIEVTNTTNGIIFRVYGFNASGTSGTFQILNLSIGGTVQAASCTGTPTAGTISTPSAICGSGSRTLSVTGASSGTGITYRWEAAFEPVASSFTTISGTTSTSYTTPTITSTRYYRMVATCATSSLSATTSIATVSVTPNPVLTLSPTPAVYCQGASGITLSASGATSYTWTPALGLSATTGATVTSSPTTTVTYAVVGSTSGCSSSSTITVTYDPDSLNIDPSSGFVCEGGIPLNINASGASTYSWSPADGLSATTGSSVYASPTANTVYTLVGTTTLGCSFNRTVLVNYGTVPPPTITSSRSSICVGDTGVILSASGSDFYSWSPSTSLSASTGNIVRAIPSENTIYTVTATTTSSCVSSNTVAVSVNPVPVVSVSPENTNICEGGDGISLSATGATSYYWYPVSGLTASTGVSVTANPSSNTTYYVVGTTLGCSDTASAQVNYHLLPNAGIISGSSTVGVSDTVHLVNTVLGGTWSTSNAAIATITEGGVLTGVSSGDVTVSYTVLNEYCSRSSIFIVSVCPAVIPTFTDFPTSVTCLNNTVLYTTQDGNSKYIWTIAGILGVDYEIVGGSLADTSNSVSIKWKTGGAKNVSVKYCGAPDFIVSTTNVPFVNPIYGEDTIVAGGASTILHNDSLGGIWSSSNLSVALVDSVTGEVWGVNPGSTIITYTTVLSGCTVSDTFLLRVIQSPYFYSKAVGALDSLSTWGSNTDGSGSNPINFSTPGTIFYLRNNNPGNISGASFTISGVSSKLVLDSTDLVITSAKSVMAKVDVGRGRVLKMQNNTLPTLGGLDTFSTVIYNNTSAANTLSYSVTYGNIIVRGSGCGVSNTSGTVKFLGNLILDSSAVFNTSNITLSPQLSTSTIQLGAGTTSALGSTLTINKITTTQGVKVLGNGTYTDTTIGGVYGGKLVLSAAGSNMNGLILGDSTYPFNSVVCSLGVTTAVSNVSGNNVTVNPYSQFILVANGTYNANNYLLRLKGVGIPGGSTYGGALTQMGTSTWNGPIYLASDAMISTNSSVFTIADTVFGPGRLIRGGYSTLVLQHANNWQGGTLFTHANIAATASLSITGIGALSNTDLIMHRYLTTSNTLNITTGSEERVKNLRSRWNAGISGSPVNTISLGGGTTLNIYQDIDTVFGTGSISTATSRITGSGKVIKSGPAKLSLTSNTNAFTGGLDIVGGELNFAISSLHTAATETINSPVTLIGGMLSTTGIVSNATINFGTLTVLDTVYITLDSAVAHNIKYTASNAVLWPDTALLKIKGWKGLFNGTSGTQGRLFVGTSSTALTAAQLSKIIFVDSVNNQWPSAILSTGEIVPTPACGSSIDIGTTTSLNDSVCAGSTMTFSTSSTLGVGGITYAWYKANDISGIAGAYSSIPTAASVSLTDTVNANVWYYCVATCSYTGASDTSIPIRITSVTLPSVSSISGPSLVGSTGSSTDGTVGASSITLSATTSTGTGVWSTASTSIVTVNASGLVTAVGTTGGTGIITYTATNTFGCSSQATKNVNVYCYPSPALAESYNVYVSFNTTSALSNITFAGESTPAYNVKSNTMGAVAARGSTVNFSGINRTPSYPGYVNIYIDWNQSGTFADSTSELVYSSGSISSGATFSGSFTVPTSARPGRTTLRVVFGEYGVTGPCGVTYHSSGRYYGNILDFSFKVPGISVTPAAINFGAVAFGTTVDSSYSISATELVPSTGNISIVAPGNQYKVSLDGVSYSDSVILPYGTTSAGSLSSTNVHVAYTPTALSASGNVLNRISSTSTPVSVNGSAKGYWLTPSRIDFGSISATDSAVASFDMLGQGLSGSGNITLSPTDSRYLVSLSATGPFSSILNIPISSGVPSTGNPTRIYVKFLPGVLGIYPAFVDISGGGFTAKDTLAGAASTPCVAPTASASSLIFNTITSDSINISFTPAVPTCDSYLFVRSTTALSGMPINGANYSFGTLVGSNGTSIGHSASSPVWLRGLSGNTKYTLNVFSENNTLCFGGPLYYTAAPLNDTFITCPSAPASTTVSGVTDSSFNISWGSSVGGGATLITYRLEVSSDSMFTTLLSGYPALMSTTTALVHSPDIHMNTRYYYRVSAIGSCSSSYAKGSVLTNCLLPIVSASKASGISICYGVADTLTMFGAGASGVYSWSPSAGISVSGSIVTFSPSVTTTYTVTAANVYGCAEDTTFVIAVNTNNVGLSISPLLDTICDVTSRQLTILGTSTALSNTFNDDIFSQGWKTTGALLFQQRTSGMTVSTTTVVTPDASKFYGVLAAYTGVYTTSYLESPSFSLNGLSAATLSFYRFFNLGSSASAGCQISTNGGTSWTNISTLSNDGYGGTKILALTTVNLTPYIGNSNCKIRFYYTTSSGTEWFFGVDRPTITGTPLPTWSPSAGLYTNALATSTYAGAPAASVYAGVDSTSVIDTYRAYIGGCPIATNAVIIKAPLSYCMIGDNTCSADGDTLGMLRSQISAKYQLYRNDTVIGDVIHGTGSSLTFGIYTHPGTYKVVASNDYGCQTSISDTVSIGVMPAPYSIVNSGNVCSDTGVVILLDTTTIGSTYQLYKNGMIFGTPILASSSSVAFPTVIDVANYTVRAYGSPFCELVSDDTVKLRTLPAITIGASPSVCRPASSANLSYSSPVGAPTTYDLTWNSTALAAGFSGVTGSSLGSSIAIGLADTAGTYTGTILVHNGICSGTAQPFSVNIYNYPVASVTSVTVPCLGYAGNLVFTGTAGANISYTVDGGAPASAVLTGGTYTLSTGAIAEPHTYALINANNIACTNIDADTIITITPNAMQWLGTVSSDWNDGSNWKCGFQPTASDDAIIPSGTTYSPELVAAGTGTTRNITIQSGAAVALNSDAILSVKGSVSNDGQITGSGKVALNGTSSQTITGIGSLNNLELDNTSGVSVSGASRMTIRRTLTITSGTLNTNDSVVLASDASATARVAPIVSGGINGQVQLQKYIPGGRRAFRFLSHPFAEAMSLMQWQDGDIDITGTGGATNGFTTTGSNASSAFRYDPTVGNSASSYDPGWKAITNLLSSTSDSNWMQRYQGMRVFVRGSKGEGMGYASYTPSATTLTMKGNLNQGNQVVYMSKGSSSGQDYNLLGNPYASPVDIGTIAYNAKVSGNMVGAAVYVWNPYMATSGIFQAVPVNTVSATPYYLEANGAFEIRAAHNGDSLVFTESSKSANVTTSLVKAIPEYVSLMVYDANNKPWDMMYVRFDEGAKDEEESDNDAIKLKNPDFSIYSMSTDGKALAIDARPYNAEKVIPMGIESKVAQDYVIKAEGVSIPAGASLYLHDKQLNKYVELTQGASYSFTISASTGSGVDTRFELSMRQGSAVAGSIKGLSVSMTPNPASEDVKISFVNGKKESVKVRLLDMNGVSIYNEDMGVRSSGVVTIPLSNYAAGIYMVELTSGSQVVTKRLVKE